MTDVELRQRAILTCPFVIPCTASAGQPTQAQAGLHTVFNGAAKLLSPQDELGQHQLDKCWATVTALRYAAAINELEACRALATRLCFYLAEASDDEGAVDTVVACLLSLQEQRGGIGLDPDIAKVCQQWG